MHDANEVKISIYRISQNLQTKKITFFVYSDILYEGDATRIYTHKELYDLLCDHAQIYNDGGYYL